MQKTQHQTSGDQVKASSLSAKGSLYVVATPIGNLSDMTTRAIEVLNNVDMIAAEDTRHSQRLLASFTINTRLQAYHEHNESSMTPRLLQMMREGTDIALISDAGTPLISDPGYRLVSAAHDEGIRVVPIPGANAAITALCVSGLATDRFSFEGFLPAKSSARQQRLQSVAGETATMIFYESCHRILQTLADMRDILGDTRQICFAREITKTFETIRRDSLESIHDWVSSDENQRKGEIVLVVDGKRAQAIDSSAVDQVLHVLLTELPVKQAVKIAVKLTGGNKNTIYKRAIELNNDE
jgi:16S rRNA (cytidine1402-2'-O)-methyltransferase